jgi:hypothetical protein
MHMKTIARTNLLKTTLSAALVALCFGCASPTGGQPDPAAAAGEEYLRACSQEDWDKAGRLYLGTIPPAVKERFGGAELLAVGKSFERPRQYDGRFVPYQVRFKTGTVIKRQLAMKLSPTGWRVDGGL